MLDQSLGKSAQSRTPHAPFHMRSDHDDFRARLAGVVQEAIDRFRAQKTRSFQGEKAKRMPSSEWPDDCCRKNQGVIMDAIDIVRQAIEREKQRARDSRALEDHFALDLSITEGGDLNGAAAGSTVSSFMKDGTFSM